MEGATGRQGAVALVIFHLTIRADNAAFEPEPHDELARILRHVAYQLEHESYDQFRTIFDVNGNDVGRFALRPDDYA